MMLTAVAPAKLNLFLHVVGRRADGLHLLQTQFCFIDYADTLTFSERADAQICLMRPLPGVPPSSDLCVRAARLLQRETGCTAGVDIGIDKRIPMGGGLGGGSSDAATTLIALNRLWKLGLSRQHLMALGLSLGADVPVFVFGQNAFAEGVGEQLQVCPAPPVWYVVLVPPVSVPTVQIFTDPELTRNTNSLTMRGLQTARLHNDLQPVACKLYPEVEGHLKWLGQFAPAMMTGSGACVFAAFGSESEARDVLCQLPEAMRGWVAQGLPRHPLYDWVSA